MSNLVVQTNISVKREHTSNNNSKVGRPIMRTRKRISRISDFSYIFPSILLNLDYWCYYSSLDFDAEGVSPV